MKTYLDFYREISAVLQFPPYFGWNWAALDECLADLSWSPAPYLLLCVENADQMLAEEGAGVAKDALKLLRRICEEHSESDDKDQTKIINLIFHFEDERNEIIKVLADEFDSVGIEGF